MTYESNIFRFTVKHIETLLVIKNRYLSNV